MTELSEDDAALIGRKIGGATAANARVLTALISLLVRQGAISADTIEKDLLDKLQGISQGLLESIHTKPDQSEADQADIDSAKHTILIVKMMRDILFRDDDQ